MQAKMQLSIQRLRWTLTAGAMLLVAVLAAYIGYGRYRALKAYRQILAHSGVSLTHDSNSVTWSQSMKNRKLYTIRAKTESALGDGQYGLHDAELLLYTRSEDHPDRIYGSEMVYDQKAGILRAKGEVFMDIQPPQALASSSRSNQVLSSKSAQSIASKSRNTPDQVIHVRTSDLIYLQKLGLASTDKEVDFSYGGMRCQSLGAEFNADQSTVRLLANVRMDGFAHGQPLHIMAKSADMNRNTNLATITQPVVVTSNGRTAKADTALLHLRRDGSIKQVEGNDHVTLSEGTRQVTAAHLNAILTPASVLQTGRLSGGVVLVDSDVMRPTHGSAQFIDALFDAEGAPQTVRATGSAKLSMLDRRSYPRGLARSMEGNQISAYFVREHSTSSPVLKQIHAVGSARASGESVSNQQKNLLGRPSTLSSLKKIQVAAEDLRALFAVTSDGKVEPQVLYGTDQTALQQDASFGEQELSTGDLLEIAFSQGPKDSGQLSVSSAVQTGNVGVRDRAASKLKDHQPGALSTGSADRAAYDGSTQMLTLAGNAHLYGNSASIFAPTIRLNENTQDVDATGGVQTTFENAPSDPALIDTDNASSSGASSDSVTHILSATAQFLYDTHSATFLGMGAQPVFMWHSGSQVKAAVLYFDGLKHTFSASQNRSGDLVHAVFASAGTSPKSQAEASSIIHVASPHMSFDDLRHEAVFNGGVTIDGSMGEVRGKQAVVFLLPSDRPSSTTSKKPDQNVSILQSQPSPLNGSIDRIVVYGSVQLDQPGRRASGEQLMYTAATQSCVLTGTPKLAPHIVDEQQGNITGKTLLFTNAGSTIVVAGGVRTTSGAGDRVRSEMRIGPTQEKRQ